MPLLSSLRGWVALEGVFSIFCLVLASNNVYGNEDFGIYIEFDNACDKGVLVWLNSEQPAGEIGPGQTSRFPICTDSDCTKAWGLPKAYSYTFGAQTVEDWPCDLQGGSGEITVSATAPVRVYGYHQIDCNACPNEDRNESKQVPAILIGGSQSPPSISIPAPAEVSPLPDKQDGKQPPAPLPPIPTPRAESPPPLAVVVETPSPVKVQPVPVPAEQSPPPPRVFTPEGGNLFAFGGSSSSSKLKSTIVLAIILGAWILI
eukprot:jgi/Picsp_1/3846/NSC_01358-R1_---NA---